MHLRTRSKSLSLLSHRVLRHRVLRHCVLSFCVLSLLLLFSACVSSLGTEVEPEEELLNKFSNSAKLPSGIQVSVIEVLDAREEVATEEGGTRKLNAGGAVDELVEKALVDAFTTNGSEVTPTATNQIRGQIRDWHVEITGAATGKLSSTASLYIETLAPDGKVLFSGMYNGSRASEFPIVSRQDVGQSLSISMNEAITQLMSDQGFVSSLRQ